jgi:hypothetical protein
MAAAMTFLRITVPIDLDPPELPGNAGATILVVRTAASLPPGAVLAWSVLSIGQANRRTRRRRRKASLARAWVTAVHISRARIREVRRLQTRRNGGRWWEP